jgi:hypothetical protein
VLSRATVTAHNAGGWNNETYRIQVRHIHPNDITHRITLPGVYLLPVVYAQIRDFSFAGNSPFRGARDGTICAVLR